MPERQPAWHGDCWLVVRVGMRQRLQDSPRWLQLRTPLKKGRARRRVLWSRFGRSPSWRRGNAVAAGIQLPDAGKRSMPELLHCLPNAEHTFACLCLRRRA